MKNKRNIIESNTKFVLVKISDHRNRKCYQINISMWISSMRDVSDYIESLNDPRIVTSHHGSRLTIKDHELAKHTYLMLTMLFV